MMGAVTISTQDTLHSQLAIMSFLLKQTPHVSRHKLVDKFRKDPYVVIKCGADQSVFVIRPAFCGTDRQVNCKMPFLDPRKEDEVPQDEYPLCCFDHFPRYLQTEG